MKIATFNANSIRTRLPLILEWLQANSPDILCIQETKTPDEEFPARDIRAIGYEAVYRGEKGYNGVAILSKSRPTTIRFGFDDGGPADETRLAHATFGTLHVINTYVPQGRKLDHPLYRYKLEWFERLRRYFDRHCSPRQKVIWLGDLNVAPTAIDIHNAKEQENHVCYHASCRKAFEAVAAWGFTDVFRMHHPEPGWYTFFDYRTPDAVKRNMGWRVDHILATKPLAQKCSNAFIDIKARLAPKASDHTFLVAEFNF
ncbi:MAG: exodeoxyribonuclease III [Kiritimatiellae bacterium]|nr:exodeoxyribonuclease III [Kiritimatiellia bacterium]